MNIFEYAEWVQKLEQYQAGIDRDEEYYKEQTRLRRTMEKFHEKCRQEGGEQEPSDERQAD